VALFFPHSWIVGNGYGIIIDWTRPRLRGLGNHQEGWHGHLRTDRGRWQSDLPAALVSEIESTWGNLMLTLGYPLVTSEVSQRNSVR
jgi:hypothetical protein